MGRGSNKIRDGYCYINGGYRSPYWQLVYENKEREGEATLAALEDLCQVGDIFVTHGYYGDLIEYRIEALFISGVEGETKYPWGTAMVQYLRHHPSNPDRTQRVCYPLRKFLFTKASGYYRRLAVRPLQGVA